MFTDSLIATSSLLAPGRKKRDAVAAPKQENNSSTWPSIVAPPPPPEKAVLPRRRWWSGEHAARAAYQGLVAPSPINKPSAIRDVKTKARSCPHAPSARLKASQEESRWTRENHESFSAKSSTKTRKEHYFVKGRCLLISKRCLAGKPAPSVIIHLSVPAPNRR